MARNKTKPRRRIKGGRIKLISLVPAGANRVESVFKDEHGSPYEEFQAVAKMGPEGYLYTLVYIPDLVDSQGDVASAPVIKDLCHSFIPSMEGSGIDILHNCDPLDPEDAHICETFIVQKGDPRYQGVRVEGKEIDPTGSWGMVLKLDHPDLQSLYSEDGWNGVSMFGTALVEPLAKDKFAKALASRLGGRNKEIEDMDEEKLAKLLGEALRPVVEGLAEVKKSLEDKPEGDDDDKKVAKANKIEFEGDPLNLEDIEKHEEEVFKASLDLSDPADLKKWKAYVVAKQESKDDDGDGKEESDEVKKAKDEAAAAQRKVEQLQKASNQSTEDVNTPDTNTTKIRKGLDAGAASAKKYLELKQGRTVTVKA